ncbi:hypothetical protein HF576_12650 [Microbacterium sp. CFH 90308]|uniref:PBP domain-containing protein n=1 Tax=Microbacterium salsuginis TaxID=2722803 RepID=A0ABX1KCE2_9MICO|nr:hypothetical protein [Microbacterium sp. CFH 90308]NLP84702.1 hypothetical protein [Microbacterium sp. CFH 90308]
MTGLVVAVITASLIGAGGAVLQAEPAAAAEDDATSSAVTLTNKDDALEPEGAPFPDLEVTISQTKDMVSQGIRVSWTGGEKSAKPDQNQGGANFLQIAQCWGEDPDNPGHPDRRTCQYGGGRAPGSDRDGSIELEALHPEDQKYSADVGGYAYSGIPFVASNSEGIVDEYAAPADRVLNNFSAPGVVKPEDQRADMANNQFFSAYTTNEVRWAGAGADGSGSVPFEVQTAMESTALGCGTPIPQPDGTAVGQSCWLVIIPRGTGDTGVSNITRSGLYWDAWEHHLAVELEFKPLGVRCQIGEAERQLAGSELVAGAVASWQPGLCRGENGAPFVLSEGSEADAAARAAGTEPSPLAFTSRPLDLAAIGDATDPLAYAPVAIAGVALTFAIDREPNPNTENPQYRDRAGLPFTEMKLTPRLVAKLLTASYLDALPNRADKDHLGRDIDGDGDIEWNPRTIVWDPEFRKINDPEWSEQVIIGASIADALLPSGRSDAAVRLWEYVLADPDARAWLDGADDGHGMFVNPWYSTNPDVQPLGVGLALPAEDFPKADPVTKPDETTKGGTGEINLVTWRPYTPSLAEGAHHVLRGDGLILGNWEPLPEPAKFGKSQRNLFGSQRVIGLTSTPAASLYHTVTASLRNPAGQFVAPTQDGLAAAAAAMTPTPAQPRVLQYDLRGDTVKGATTSYPLTMPVYAALNPQQTDEELRGVYANLIRYAVEEGQSPGTDVGELPPGYAPLPGSWVEQALVMADSIERGSLPQQGGGNPGGSSGAPRTSGPPAPPPSSAPAPVPGANAPAAGAPAATGAPAGALAGAETPEDPDAGPIAAAVPIGIGAGIVAGLAVPLVSRIRRRA